MAGKKKIDDDSELTKARKKGDLGRGERTRDTFNKCFNITIWVVFGGIALGAAFFAVMISYHMYEIRDYGGMTKALSYLATAGGGYIVSYLQSHGVNLSQS